MKVIKSKKSVFSKRKRPYGRNMFKSCYNHWMKKTHLNENYSTTGDYVLTNLEFEEFLKLAKYEDTSNYGFIIGDVIQIDPRVTDSLCGHWKNFVNFELTIEKINNNHKPGLVTLEIQPNKHNDKLKKKLETSIEKYPDSFKNVNNHPTHYTVELNIDILTNCLLIKSIFNPIKVIILG